MVIKGSSLLSLAAVLDKRISHLSDQPSACNVEEFLELEPYCLCRLPGQLLGLWGSCTLWMLFTGPSVFHQLCIFQSLAALTTCQVKHLVWGDALWSLMAPLRGHINGWDDKSEQ